MKNINFLKSITAPFADTSEHVQGPGGNTSYKYGGDLMIKASGFTFKDVTLNTGVVVLNNQLIVDNLLTKIDVDKNIFENTPPNVLNSIPTGLKPSMEFEFHSLLDNFVLHTHSVYVNVITCSNECSNILSILFNAEEYVIVPYVTPGFPIAEALLKNNRRQWPAIIFLKNHGVIIQGNDFNTVINNYNYVEHKIKEHFKLLNMPELITKQVKPNVCTVEKKCIYSGNVDLNVIEEELVKKILIPDQSIFFRNKISATEGEQKEIFIDKLNEQLEISGSQKFIHAAKAMLQSVFYIKNNIEAAGLTPEYIPAEKLDELHALSTEKYRLTLLKN